MTIFKGYSRRFVKMASAVILYSCMINLVRTEDPNKQSTTTKMITGMAAGFSFMVGLTILFVTVWCCCCGNGCDGKGHAKRRIAPSEPNTEPNTRSTSAESSRS